MLHLKSHHLYIFKISFNLLYSFCKSHCLSLATVSLGAESAWQELMLNKQLPDDWKGFAVDNKSDI